MAITETRYQEGSAFGAPNIPERAPFFKRISWGSVFAGVVVAVILQFLLGLLGVAVGAGVVNPYGNGPSISGISIGLGIWLVISSLIGLFFGGWVAGWLSGLPRGIDTVLHGIVTWGLATFLFFYIMTSAVGTVIGGAFTVLGTGLSMVGQGVGQAATSALGGMDTDRLKNDFLALADNSVDGTQRRGGVSQGNQNANLAQDTALMAIINRTVMQGKDSLEQGDREQLVSILMKDRNMDRNQAENTVNRWQDSYRSARVKIGQAKDQAGQKLTEAADAAAHGVSQAATWTFVMLTLGGIAAAIGGFVSRPAIMPTETTIRPSSRTTSTKPEL